MPDNIDQAITNIGMEIATLQGTIRRLKLIKEQLVLQKLVIKSDKSIDSIKKLQEK
jgi:hypothetical protein